MLRIESTTDTRLGVTVIAMSGTSRTATADDLDRAVTRITAQKPGFVILDLSRLEIISSLAIGCILSIRRAVVDHGGSVSIAAPSLLVRKALEIARLDELMETHATFEEALAPARDRYELARR